MAGGDIAAGHVVGLMARRIDWDAAYAEHLPRVFNFFRYRLPGADTEDLTAATFEKAWRRRDSYREELASLGTWLLAIARNVAIDHLRSAQAHAPLEEAEHMAAGATPEDHAAGKSDRSRLAALVARLSEADGELIALKYGAGLTNREIAKVTGMSESNVGTTLHRTVQKLRNAWDTGE